MHKGRKNSGGKYHKQRKKKHAERASHARNVSLGETKRKVFRVKGGNKKTSLLKADQANILIRGKVQKAEIKNVLETPQNTFFARQNRLMKGALIQTSLGKAKITNRPGQEGHINAILVE